MPRKNGLEVLRWLRAHEDLGDLTVCVITSSGETQDREEAASQGVEAYCVKPVAFEELVRIAERPPSEGLPFPTQGDYHLRFSDQKRRWRGKSAA